MSEALQQTDELRVALDEAHALVTQAITILDAANAPADIAAHLDLAVHRMKPYLAG